MTKKGRRLKDAKAELAEKRRKKRRRKRVLFLFLEIIVFVFLGTISYGLLKYGKLDTQMFQDDEIMINDGMEKEGYTTVALFGGDSREGVLGEGTHADTIMVASIDNQTKEVRIASVYRDTMTKQANGEIKKANYAYFSGGPSAAINMLNRNFDLDIMDYVTVDFTALADVVDTLGGLEIDVTDAEAAEMNNYIGETATVTGREAKQTQGGLQTLDGAQAVTYARIRKNVGGDYARTDRQRVIIQKLVEKVKRSDLITINGILNDTFEKVSTSFSLKELIQLAAGTMKYEIVGTSGFPFERIDGSVSGIGSVVVPLGVVENVEELHAFLYPKSDYIVSDIVREIGVEIENLSGYTRADYDESAQSE